jgi:hypothetical protein
VIYEFHFPGLILFSNWFQFQLNHAYAYAISCNMSVLCVPHQKEKFAHYIRRAYSRWQSHSSPKSVLANLIYAIAVSVPAEEHNIHIWHTSPLIPQVAPTHLTLQGQRCIRHKDVFTSSGSGHKTFQGLYSPWVRGHYSLYDRRQPLPHDRDCLKQTSPWGNGARIHITRHEDTYLRVGASLQKSKLQKVNTESKSLLACHLSRLL